MKYIKKFKAITVSGVCKDLGIDKSNLYRGNASAEAIYRVKEEIRRRVKELED